MPTEQTIPIAVFKGYTPFDWYPWPSNAEEPPVSAAIFLKHDIIKAVPHGAVYVFEQLCKGIPWDNIDW